MSDELRALVTGASSGIGLAFARALRRRGERLVLVARRAERLARLQAELGGAAEAASVPLDLAQPGGPAQLEAELKQRGLAVDLLVNNAGVGDTGRFHGRPLERSLAVVDLNVRALVELTRRLVPPMVARGRGRVVNVASMSAFQPVPYLAVYAASKAFVLSFSEALATELAGTGVRVQALCPGLVRTEFQREAGTDRVAFDRTPAQPVEWVVERSLRALDAGTLRVVPGLADRLRVALAGILPDALVRRAAAALFRPR